MAWPVLATDNVFTVKAEGRLDAQQIILTMTYIARLDSGTAQPMDNVFNEMQNVLDGFGVLSSVYADCLSVDVVNISYIYQRVSPLRNAYKIIDTVNPTGTVAEASLPPNVAHVITLRTDTAGRTQVGNKHIAGVPPSFTAGGQLTPAGLAKYNDLGLSLITPQVVTVGGAVYTMFPALYHKAAPANSQIVNNYYTQRTTRVERRRTVGQGS